MKLNAKQQEIKDRVLGEERAVLCNDVGAEKAIDIFNCFERFPWEGKGSYYGAINGCLNLMFESEIQDRPIINMSEWFDEDFQGNREYDEELLFKLKVYLQDECYIKPSFIYNFLDKRYPNELLKEKEELEARLKEINEKLNG